MKKITVEHTSGYTAEEALDIAASAIMWNKTNRKGIDSNHVIGYRRTRKAKSGVGLQEYNASAFVEVRDNRSHIKIRRAKNPDYKNTK